MVPGLAEFRELARKGNLVPVYKELLLDTDTPVSAFLKLGESPSFLLESVEGGEKWARYSFLGLRPSKVIRGFGKEMEVTDEEGNTETFRVDDPVEFLKETVSGIRPVEVPGLPRFFGGLVGYLGYDVVRFIEEIPDEGRESLGFPDVFMMLTDTLLIFDALKQTLKVVSNARTEGREPEEAYEEAKTKIDSVIEALSRPVSVEHSGALDILATAGDGPPAGDFSSAFGPREEFEAAVVRTKEYIMSGDIVQAVLSQRFQRSSDVDPFSVYRALRLINPSPYMYYLDTGGEKLVGSSPEILVRLEGDDITLRPIAGTRPRGGTDAEDLELERELKADPKEMAEHIMLVDLGRNDVGRVAETGSVSVTELMGVERYSHVMHMVSNVKGKLQPGRDAFDVLRASFPAGTVTGAPKVRAMEIIEELEPTRRGPYAGAVGYFGYSGNMDTCITIRTIIINKGKVYVQAGAGIVADSVPEREYDETVSKARAMMKAVETAERLFGDARDKGR